MSYTEFIEEYCKQQNLKLIKERRVSGPRLLKLQILVYLLRIKPDFQISFPRIAQKLLISRHSAIRFYYNVLSSDIYRQIAEDRYEEVYYVGDVQDNEPSKASGN